MPIAVSEFELSQYKDTSSYEETGLPKSAGLSVTQILLDNAQSGNSLVPGTKDNVVMEADGDTAVFQSLSFKYIMTIL